MSSKISSITLNGVDYSVKQFSTTVIQLVEFYNRLLDDIEDHQFALHRAQAALTTVHTQLNEQVQAELQQKQTGKK